ncbi:uncharacterized protein LOC132714480 [Ruditapes philippinarum]|uniref:uncharacterized protein LOC132714480 n=1 Tax=Ruditapes philippinarum TaxID=129788 RepID=UPI00295B6935|nr:uncharacterized protein LOC132714480 [Ruditapes philippinarum]
MHVSEFITLFVFLQYANSVPIDTAPEEDVDTEQRQKRSATIVEFLMDSESRHKLLHDQTALPDAINPNKDDFGSNLVCPEEVSNDPDGDVNELSTCPWYYSASHDPTRFPATVINAEPLCEYAVGSNKMYECVPITHKLKVLRQLPSLDESDKYVWVEEVMTTVIGFTASGRRIAVTDGQQSSSTTPTRFTTTSASTASTQSSQPTPEWA